MGNDQLQHFEGVSAKYNHIQYVSDMTGKVVCLPLNPRKRPLLSFSVFLTRTTKIQPGGEFVGCVGQIDKWDRIDVCDLAGRESREVCCIVESVSTNPANMQLGNSLVSLVAVHHNSIPVSIKNTGECMLVVRKGSRIANLSLITPECVCADGEEPRRLPTPIRSIVWS